MEYLASVLAAVLSATLTSIGSYFLNKKKADDEHEIEVVKTEAEIEDQIRMRLYEESERFRLALQQEILSMRERLIKLEEDKLKCAIENAELRAKIHELEARLDILNNEKESPKS